MNRNVPAKASVRIKGPKNASTKCSLQEILYDQKIHKLRIIYTSPIFSYNSTNKHLDHPSSAAPDPLSELHVLENDEFW